MKRALAVFVMLFGLSVAGFAGTPQENYYQGQAPLSGGTILLSTASPVSIGNYTLTVPTPTVVNSGGAALQGRNCFTKFVLQLTTSTVVTIADNNTTKWTIYGAGLGTTGTNTLSLPEDHLGPWCTAAGDQTVFTLTNLSGSVSLGAEALNVEGYTTYGGTTNSGPMY